MRAVNELPTIYFIRHGETEWNKQRKLQGRTDISLNDTGLRQARAMAQVLAQALAGDGPDTSVMEFHVSPLKRARETMAAVLSEFNLDAATARIDDRLIERSFGVHEGATWPELNAAGIDPEIDAEAYYDWRPEGGESATDVAERLGTWLREIDRPSVVVSHGGVSRILRGLIFELPKAEVPFLRVPQNRFYRIHQGEIEWFDARGLLL